MIKLLSRGVVAVMGSLMLTFAGPVSAQSAPAPTSTPLLNTSYSLTGATVAKTPVVAAVQRTVQTTQTMFNNAVGGLFGTTIDPRQAENAKIAREAAWLRNAGWPLYALVDRFAAGTTLDEQATCLATTVYFEARGESVDGQLAVARVVMNRAASGKYPASWCEVMKQPWQFSFVNPHTGNFPAINFQSASWARAQGIARLAMANAYPSLDNDVLWYHADYVAPSWGRRLSYVDKIGAHIFYRA
ncbi:cell wall hydrolase [Sphingomonas sabuli]|uniref:Cell wall hydrolase n=1 Tax=Sphingomonas sabuli TaxID=2764186 RepID=A0A7G9L2G0_9SPHN|nr:cell wall hydrolase [Sphingomonas sabuli]QNM82809.1 cell wall hydrolase [Sphingomonas sabuli]